MGKETAEKKLLKLIESTDSEEAQVQGKASGSAEAQKALNSVQGVGVSPLNLPPLLANIVSALQGILALTKPSSAQSAEGMGLREVNKVLFLLILVIGVVFALDVMNGMKMSKKELEYDVLTAESSLSNNLLPTFRELAEYVTDMARRNIFHHYEPKIVEEIIEPEEIPTMQIITEKTQNLKLVGISWLDTPESASAMIENINSGVTYFLQVGEIINDLKIDKIYADSIVITFEGEEMEMRL